MESFFLSESTHLAILVHVLVVALLKSGHGGRRRGRCRGGSGSDGGGGGSSGRLGEVAR